MVSDEECARVIVHLPVDQLGKIEAYSVIISDLVFRSKMMVQDSTG